MSTSNQNLVIVCLNVGGGNLGKPTKQEQADAIAAYIDSYNADIVLVQEWTRIANDECFNSALEAKTIDAGSWRFSHWVQTRSKNDTVIAYNNKFDAHHRQGDDQPDILRNEVDQKGRKSFKDRYSAVILKIKSATEPGSRTQPTNKLLVVSYHGRNNGTKGKQGKVKKSLSSLSWTPRRRDAETKTSDARKFIELVAEVAVKERIPAIIGGDWNMVGTRLTEFNVLHAQVHFVPVTQCEGHFSQCKRFKWNKHPIDFFVIINPDYALPLSISNLMASPHQDEGAKFDHDPLLATLSLGVAGVELLPPKRTGRVPLQVNEITPQVPPASLTVDELELRLKALVMELDGKNNKIASLERLLAEQQARQHLVGVQASVPHVKQQPTDEVPEMRLHHLDGDSLQHLIKTMFKQNRLYWLNNDSLVKALSSARITYGDLRVAELRKLCEESGLTVTWRMAKAKLIDLLKEQDKHSQGSR